MKKVPLLFIALLAVPAIVYAQANFLSIFGADGCSSSSYCNRISGTATPATVTISGIAEMVKHNRVRW